MNEQKSRARVAKTIIAIYCASLPSQLSNSLALILQGVSETYPGATVSGTQSILALAALGMLVGTLAGGKLANFFTKKKIIMAGFFLNFVAGILGYFFTFQLFMVYVVGILAGFSCGIMLTSALSVIAENFEGRLCAVVMSFQSVAIGVGAMLINFFGGLLAAVNWRYLFFIFIGLVLFNVIIGFFLPNGQVVRAEKGEKAKVLTPFVVTMMVTAFFVGISLITLNANITMYVFELKLGTEATAGMITTAYAIGSIVIGTVVTLLMKLFGKFVFAVGMAMGAAGLWIFALTGSFVAFVIAAVFIGFCFNLHNVAYYSVAPLNCSPAATTMAISLYTAFMTLGMVVGPYIVTPLASLMGTSLSHCFMVGAILVTAMAVFELFMPKLLGRYRLELPEK